VALPARTRTCALAVAPAVLLAGPTVLAFFTGGYFEEARAWAGLGAWALVAVTVALWGGRGRAGRVGWAGWAGPYSKAGWIALAGIGLLAAWTLASLAWAPIAGAAYGAGQVAVLYAGALLAAALLFRSRPAQPWVEPALAAGTLVVTGYGLSDRLLPGVLHFAHSVSARGRLEQPLTYWNAMGELAAIGFVLCVHLAGAQERRAWLRAGAAAASAPLGLGLYLSFSRGALFAGAAGLIALVAAAPRREQIEALGVAILAGGACTAGTAPLGGVTSLIGGLATRERQGAIALALLVAVMLTAGSGQLLVARSGRGGPVRLPRGARWLALALVCGGLALAIGVGAKETTSIPKLSAGPGRLVSLESNRYAYWSVALKAFGAEPFHGVGAGGWAVWWLRYRTVSEFAVDAHSLPLQTAAELGLVGLAALGLLFGGVAAAARTAHHRAPGLAAGPIAALVVYAAHAPLDWDWQMPAVTLVALLLAGLVLALAGATADQRATSTARGERTRRSFRWSRGRSIT
jgi:O-Antigen ligase